jgi:iron complex transport system ATP-binding protein
MIGLHDVRLTIAQRPLVEGIDAQLPSGSFTAVLGPNGVGKTTLLRSIAGLHPLSGGRIDVDGATMHGLGQRERAQRVAFVTGDSVLLEALCVRDVVAIGRYPHHRWWEWRANDDDEDAIAAALRAVQLDEMQRRLVATLSSGELQRVWIAMGLAQATPVLLLDEPTSHLDVRVAHRILALLRDLARSGKTIVCVLHDLNEAAAHADRLLLLGCERMLAFGPPERVLDPPIVEAAYGIAMTQVQLADGSIRIFPKSDI